MNEATQKFISSIKEKIQKYTIDTTFKEVVDMSSGIVAQVKYNTGKTEVVDTGIEAFLCRKSASYFISKYAWLDFPGLGIIPFNLYYFQENILQDLLSYRKIIFEKVRQCGLSTLTSLYCLWRANFFESEYIDIVSIKQQKAQNFVSKMDATIERMPAFLKTPIVKDNQQELEFQNHSKIVSESQSENAGRSDSLSLLVLDEAAHYRSERMVRGIVAAAQPTLSRTGGQFLVISTPNGIAGAGAYYHEQVVQSKSGLEDNAKLVTVDWWEIPDVSNIPGHKKGYNSELFKAVKENYFRKESIKRKYKGFFDPIAEEAWRDNKWLKQQHDDLGEILYKQEILHSFIVGEHSVFNEDIIKRVAAELIEPKIKDKLGNNRIDNLWIWKNPTPKHRYIMGCDVSTGTGKDSSSFQIMDVENYEQVAEYKGYISTKLFGRFIKMAAKYYNQAFVVIECNGVGEAVFNEVYYDDNDSYQNVFKQLKRKNNISRMTGWITDTKTRKLVTNELIDWFLVDELWNEFKMYSRRLHYEMATWIWDGSKVDHASGAHDDTLIAMSLAVYLRNKVEEAGESFLITEDGSIVEYDSKDNLDEDRDDVFDVFFGEEDEMDIIRERHGMDKEHYDWLVGR